MLLDGLGVDAEVFVDLQRKAVKDAEVEVDSMVTCADWMEKYGLGTHFCMPSLMRKLASIPTESDAFIRRVMKVTLYHVLRDLKQRTRIPVPDSWTLVGVADEHDILGPEEIYGMDKHSNYASSSDPSMLVCIQHPDEEPFWMEGDTLIFRSPVIHPGDGVFQHNM
jgi:RNA-dependent RNA polymerase